jgi:hypothetical protein
MTETGKNNLPDINQSLIWSVDNERLVYLDSLRADLMARLAMFEDEIADKTPSKVTGNKIQRKARRIREVAQEISTGTKLEEIILKDILRTTCAAEAIRDLAFSETTFKTRGNGSNLSFPTYLLHHFGRVPKASPFTILRNAIANQDHKGIDRYFELNHRSMNRSRVVSIKGILEQLEERVLPRAREISYKFGELMHIPQDAIGGMPPLRIHLDSTTSSFSLYDGVHNDMILDTRLIRVTRERGGEEKIWDGSILVTAAHERAHNLNGIASELSLPQFPGLNPAEERYNSLYMGLSEGIARASEGFCILQLFKHFKETLGFTDEDLEAIEMDTRYSIAKKINQIGYTLKFVTLPPEIRDSFTAASKLAKDTGINLWSRDSNILDDFSFSSQLYEISTVLGLHHVKVCMQDANERYGREAIESNLGLVARGFLTGAWQFETHYQFLFDVYLPKLESLGILPKRTEKK